MKYKQSFYFVLATLLIFGTFYWFEWRPSEIRKLCVVSTRERTQKTNSSVQEATGYYEFCIHEQGLAN